MTPAEALRWVIDEMPFDVDDATDGALRKALQIVEQHELEAASLRAAAERAEAQRAVPGLEPGWLREGLARAEAEGKKRPELLERVRQHPSGFFSEPEPFEVDGVRYLTPEESQRDE